MRIETITICGGGNAAHTMIPIIQNHFSGKINLYLPFGDEATYFQRLIDENKSLTATIGDIEVYGQPDMVSNSAEKACKKADLILMPLPAFAHEQTLQQIAPFIKNESIIGAIPARSGFEYAALTILRKNKKEKVKIFGMQTLPWACRIREYALKVNVLGKKRSVGIAAFPHETTPEIAEYLSSILDLNLEALPNMLTLTLANVGQIIHPGIMYGLFRGKEHIAYKKDSIPLFYQGVTEEIAEILKRVSDEILVLTEKIKSSNKSVNLEHVKSLREWLLYSYKGSIADESTLQKCFTTNSAYQGLYAPVKQVGDVFYPDFQARYLTEDVPFGLVVIKSIAQLIEVKTPMIDEITLTISKWIGKEYLKKGELRGKDIWDTRIPQKYGIKKFEEIIMY